MVAGKWAQRIIGSLSLVVGEVYFFYFVTRNDDMTQMELFAACTMCLLVATYGCVYFLATLPEEKKP